MQLPRSLAVMYSEDSLTCTRLGLVSLHTDTKAWQVFNLANFWKTAFVFCFYLKSSSVSKPEGHLVFFSFEVCAALVLTVLRVHKGPFFPPQKLAFGNRHCCKVVPKLCFLSFSHFSNNLNFAIGNTWYFCSVDVPHNSEYVVIDPVWYRRKRLRATDFVGCRWNVEHCNRERIFKCLT